LYSENNSKYKGGPLVFGAPLFSEKPGTKIWYFQNCSHADATAVEAKRERRIRPEDIDDENDIVA
jgi:hypothetical protein